jgi:hypothetical protein
MVKKIFGLFSFILSEEAPGPLKIILYIYWLNFWKPINNWISETKYNILSIISFIGVILEFPPMF